MSDQYMMPPDCPLDEVEWRADSEPYSQRSGWSARWVPHLTYTTCARLLDEWVGPNNWRIDGYKPSTWVDGGLVCQVSIRFPGDDEWVSRQSAGDVPHGQHAVKGAETDAFKRTVGRSWGCGRNVYTLPTLWAPCDERKSRAGKASAVMNSATVPALIDQLKSLGFDPGDALKVVHDHAEIEDRNGSAPVVKETGGGTSTAADADGVSTPPVSSSEPTETNLMEMLGTLHAQKDVISQLRGDGLWPLGSLIGEAHEKAHLVIKAAHATEKIAAK